MYFMNIIGFLTYTDLCMMVSDIFTVPWLFYHTECILKIKFRTLKHMFMCAHFNTFPNCTFALLADSGPAAHTLRLVLSILICTLLAYSIRHGISADVMAWGGAPIWANLRGAKYDITCVAVNMFSFVRYWMFYVFLRGFKRPSR